MKSVIVVIPMPKWLTLRRRPPGGDALDVDWTLCQGRGLCAEILPEWLGLDPWGFPVVPDDLPEDLLKQARRAAKSCPTRALTLGHRSASQNDTPACRIPQQMCRSESEIRPGKPHCDKPSTT